MSALSEIERKLNEALAPTHLRVENESGRHNVPPGSETHFKVVVVSDAFSGQSLVARHRQVYGLLEGEIKGGVHALSIQAHTPDEWRRSSERTSPNCAGGNGK